MKDWYCFQGILFVSGNGMGYAIYCLFGGVGNNNHNSGMRLMTTSSKPVRQWVDDWVIHMDRDNEQLLGSGMIRIFQEFWTAKGLDGKSKSTRNRYANALHALGGHIIDQVFGYQTVCCSDFSEAKACLLRFLDPDEGPLIHEKEAWQREVDTTCRKLLQFLTG